MIATLTFDINGNGFGLYTEAIPLQQIGQLELRRATNIEFNHQEQKWEVVDLDSKVLFSSPSRTVCLAWEAVNLLP